MIISLIPEHGNKRTYEVASLVQQLQVLLEEEFQTGVAAFDPVDLSRTLYQLAILSHTTFRHH